MATKTAHGKKVGVPKSKTKHLHSDKTPALLGWCTAGQHKQCWKETDNYVCYCKCHKKGKSP